MLGGFVLLGQAAGTYRLQRSSSPHPPSGTAVTVGAGARARSARSPSRRSTRSTPGCPAAMVAPTPVSAYLHSATMVKAGVYLVARFAPAFADVPHLAAGRRRRRRGRRWSLGGLRALRQYDLKLLLAFGTVSQLGFLIVLFGVGTPEATTAGVRDAPRPRRCSRRPLFMVVGIVDHQTGTRDIREHPARSGAGWRPLDGRGRRGVGRRWPACRSMLRVRRQGGGVRRRRRTAASPLRGRALPASCSARC